MAPSHAMSLVVLLLCLSSSPPVRGNAELKALMDLKSSLDPENKQLRSWTFNGDPCGGFFAGVACNGHGKVANISLQGRNLTGKLSPAVGEFKCLSGLYLHYNDLSGEIPKEITGLTELSDLYLNVNNFSGEIPAEIGAMAGLQVLELCNNQLTGKIPEQIGSLKKLSVLSLQFNRLTGDIPSSLASLSMLERLDVRNNSLSGIVPPGLKKSNARFQFENNPGLCGAGFSLLRPCTPFDTININQVNQPLGHNSSDKYGFQNIPSSVNIQRGCNQTHCQRSSKLLQIAVISSAITVTITIMGAGFLTFFRYRRRKQKISNTAECSEGGMSTDHQKDLSTNGASPLMSLVYGAGFSQENHDHHHSHHVLMSNSFRFSLEEIESATQCFSETNILDRSNFSAVFKGKLRDGSLVSIRSISINSCKNEEAEFSDGLNLLASLSHKNLVKLRGFCCSRGRGECFLIYEFASKGKLSKFLGVQENQNLSVLDWPTRVSIIRGIAEGVAYLHRSEPTKPAIIHRNISVEKILLDEQYNPLIADSGLHSLLADDFVFSALKTSAAMGYLAPEYVTTGRFTEKTDIFAFGVIILQVLSGELMLTNSMRAAAENAELEGFIDGNLRGKYDELDATAIARIGISCTQEIPNNRPNIETVIQEINSLMNT